MSESTTQAQQVAEKVKKVFAGLGAKVEDAVGELNKLQAKGAERASSLLETASRQTQEQIAFAEQLAGEARKLVLDATKSAAGFFQPKA